MRFKQVNLVVLGGKKHLVQIHCLKKHLATLQSEQFLRQMLSSSQARPPRPRCVVASFTSPLIISPLTSKFGCGGLHRLQTH